MKREMKDSGIPWIGLMPKEWDLVSVKNIFAITRGRVIATTELVDEGMYPVYSSQTKDEGCLGFINTYDYEKEALTWTTDGANAGTVFYRRGKFNCTNVCGILTPKLELHISMRFLSYSVGFSSFFSKRADINGYKIMSNEMASIKITFPPLSTQQRIANFLDRKCAEIDELTVLQETMIAELKKYKQSVITEAVTKGLNNNVPMKDSGVEWIGEIPEGWSSIRLKFLCTIQTGNQDTQDAIEDGAYPFYVRSPIIERSNKSSFEGEGILMAGDGAGAGRVFHHVFGKYAVHQRVYRMANFYNINSDYLFYFLRSLFCMEMDRGSAQSTVPSVRLPMLQNFFVSQPPLIEQQEIADYLDTKCAEIDELISIKQQKLEALKEFKKSIIFEYVTGKKEVMG